MLLLLVLPVFFACKSQPEPKPEPVKKKPQPVVQEQPIAEPQEAPVEEKEPETDGFTVYFAPDTYVIDSFTAHKLDVIAEQLKAQNITHVKITGHSAKLDTAKAENKLSLQRAVAVAEYFRSIGLFDADSMELEGLGANEPAGSHAEITKRHYNRRVEIK
nr:OmpA family protein [Treponema phagedenis]